MRRLLIVAAVIVAVALIGVEVQYYRYRFVRQNVDVVKLLPPGEFTVVYADLDQLRRAQLLGLLAHIQLAPDQEYADFIRQTGFDYTRDLDAIAIGFDAPRTFMVGRGRFDWKKLEDFAGSHGGHCGSGGCLVPGSQPGRWVNLITIQPNVLAVAVSSSQTEADDLRPPGRRLQETFPDAPVWAKLSHSVLVNPSDLPAAFRIFAISLQSSETLTLFATPDSVQLRAGFANGSTAGTARSQLEMQTKLLQTALQRDTADRSSIATLLTGGSFQVSGSELAGRWPVTPELLKTLE